MSADPGRARLLQRLTLFDLTMIAVGSCIGAGIFLTPSAVAASLPSPAFMLGAWAFGGALTACGALALGELGAMMPGAGGVYRWLAEAYGPFVAFLYGWAYFLVVTTGAIAALAVAFATYVGSLVPLGATGEKAVALGAIAVATALNVCGVKAGSIVTNVFTVLTLAAIAAIAILGAVCGGAIAWGTERAAPPTSAIAAAMVGICWSYGGWYHASFAAAEAKHARRDVPIAMITGALLVTLVYIGANVGYLRLLSPARMAGAHKLASVAVASATGSIGATAVALAIAASTFGTVSVFTLTAPRMYFAMAEDGVFFRGMAVIHPTWRTPARAILAQSAWASALVLFWGTFESLISYVVFVDWIFLGLAAAAVVVLRRRKPDAPRPYKAIGYPFTPLAFAAVAAWLVGATLVGNPRQSLAGVALLAAGGVAYRFWRKSDATNPPVGR
jgi:APA family basic amino acid/polyamine antiporter